MGGCPAAVGLEVKATQVVRLSLAGARAKVRTGPPSDDAAAMEWPKWAGVLPLRLTAGRPEPDARMANPSLCPPAYVGAYRRRPS